MALKYGARLTLWHDERTSPTRFGWALQGTWVHERSCIRAVPYMKREIDPVKFDEYYEGNSSKLIKLLRMMGKTVRSFHLQYFLNDENQNALKFLFEEIPFLCENLEVVSIVGGSAESSTFYSSMAMAWTKLKYLEIRTTGGLNSLDLHNLLLRNKNLRNFEFASGQGSLIKTDDFLNYLPVENLQTLRITAMDENISFDNFYLLSENFIDLNELCLGNIEEFGEDMATAVGKITTLRFLHLTPKVLSEFDQNEFFGKLGKLKELTIHKNSGFNEELIKSTAGRCKIVHIE